MTAKMYVETGAPFGLLSTFPAKFRRSGSSTLNVDVFSEAVRRLVTAWEQFATPAADAHQGRVIYVSLGGPVEVTDVAPVPVQTAPSARPYPVTPVEAVEYLKDLLQISRDAVLRGTKVSESSFYRWKRLPKQDARPESLGRLWPTVRALWQLAAVHPNLTSWYHSTPEAQEAFEDGRLNRLIQLEVEWLNANARQLGPRNATSAAVAAPWFGDIADLDETDTASADDQASYPAPLKSQSQRLARSKRGRG